MARMKGLDVRALLRLGCLVFFLVILRNKFSTGNDRSSSIRTDNLSVSEFGRVEQRLSRHLLGLDEQIRSREWKQRAAKIAAIVEQGNLNTSFPDLRRGDFEGSMQHSMPVDLDKLPNPNSNVSEGFTACDNVKSHIGFPDSCSYVRANSECQSGTMIEYTVFFYCTCAKFPTLGYMFLIVWLVGTLYGMLVSIIWVMLVGTLCGMLVGIIWALLAGVCWGVLFSTSLGMCVDIIKVVFGGPITKLSRPFLRVMIDGEITHPSRSREPQAVTVLCDQVWVWGGLICSH